MASLLRKIVAGPRSRHPGAGLDLCYVTDQIIATSGPSSSYPQLAYRNPLQHLVKFLDETHKDDWAIWEFRAEGTGYPDEEVYGRIWHYPWPDHHPPPFALIPNIMASMRNWLNEKEGRVAVVHCKAGKGRSGTVACSYLISECGWKPAEALLRFTERRMRSGFGQGVSIPSQVRWIDYIQRWTEWGKVYAERQVELVELHVWGLRDGVKVAVEGYVDHGRTIKNFHIFSKDERLVQNSARSENGQLAGAGDLNDQDKITGAMQNTTHDLIAASEKRKLGDGASPAAGPETPDIRETTGAEVGGDAVIFKPKERLILPTNDINIDFERRSKATYGYMMVTAVAHVWFNTFFESPQPDDPTEAATSGVFSIDWDAMDGIKGSSRKGTRALDRLTVVWRVHTSAPPEVIAEPAPGEAVAQMPPADWKTGTPSEEGSMAKDLGLRTESPAPTHASGANIVPENSNETPAAPTSPKILPPVKSCAPEPEIAPSRAGVDTTDTKSKRANPDSSPSPPEGNALSAVVDKVMKKAATTGKEVVKKEEREESDGQDGSVS